MGRIKDPERMIKLRGRISVGQGQDGITIQIDDTASRLRICEITIPETDIGSVLFGAGNVVDVTVLNGSPHLGMECITEWMPVWIPIKHGSAKSRNDWKKLAVKFLEKHYGNTGWIFDTSCLDNSNNIMGRHNVEPQPETPDGYKPEQGNWWNLVKYRYVPPQQA